MPIILHTLSWMTYNTLLAVIPVVLIYLFVRTNNRPVRLLLFISWLLFLPNTIYLLTDIIHLPRDLFWAQGFENVIIVALYKILMAAGLATYVLAIYPLESLIKKYRDHKFFILTGLNFLVGIGLILGRVFRYNSWDILTRPMSLVETVLYIMTTASYLTVILAFSIIGTLIYFGITSSFKQLLVKITQ